MSRQGTGDHKLCLRTGKKCQQLYRQQIPVPWAWRADFDEWRVVLYLVSQIQCRRGDRRFIGWNVTYKRDRDRRRPIQSLRGYEISRDIPESSSSIVYAGAYLGCVQVRIQKHMRLSEMCASTLLRERGFRLGFVYHSPRSAGSGLTSQRRFCTT